MSHEDRRKHPRQETIQQVNFRNLEGVLPEVWLVDLTVSGCQVILRKGHLAKGQHVAIRPDGFEGQAATVRWVSGDRAGIEFARDLHPSVLEHLLKSQLSGQQAEAVEKSAMTDRFGRVLPELPPMTLYRSVA